MHSEVDIYTYNIFAITYVEVSTLATLTASYLVKLDFNVLKFFNTLAVCNNMT